MSALRVLVAAAIVAVAAPARADDDVAAVKALVAEQVRAIGAGDATAFANTFDDSGYVILPDAAGEGLGSDAIAAAAKHWLGTLGHVKVELASAHYTDTWFDAELVLTPGGRLRATGVVIQRPDDSGRKAISKIGALHLSEAVDDKVAVAEAAAGKLPALPKLADPEPESEMPDDLRPDKLAMYIGHVVADPDVVLVGSAPKEHAVGPAAVKKLLAAWRGLALRTTELHHGPSGDDMLLSWGVAHAEATFKVGGKSVKVPYRVLVIVMEPWAAAEEHGEKPKLAAVHFSVATH